MTSVLRVIVSGLCVVKGNNIIYSLSFHLYFAPCYLVLYGLSFFTKQHTAIVLNTLLSALFRLTFGKSRRKILHRIDTERKRLDNYAKCKRDIISNVLLAIVIKTVYEDNKGLFASHCKKMFTQLSSNTLLVR